ncbi:hypothetical protein C8Q73DRAFT_693638 [Cubamyces lactineus]|nr:hypothetical protein C8Q73DRAFT_693638 [Cubamyces lactineus]
MLVVISLLGTSLSLWPSELGPRYFVSELVLSLELFTVSLSFVLPFKTSHQLAIQAKGFGYKGKNTHRSQPSVHPPLRLCLSWNRNWNWPTDLRTHCRRHTPSPKRQQAGKP